MSLSTHSIPRLLDAAPELDADIFENRNAKILDLLADIQEAKNTGLLTFTVCLYCPTCKCYTTASTRVPEPIHHCGTVLQMATCAYCQQPATHWREHPESGVEPWANGHSNKGVRRG